MRNKTTSEMENIEDKENSRLDTVGNGIGDMKDNSEEIEQMNKRDHRVEENILESQRRQQTHY